MRRDFSRRSILTGIGGGLGLAAMPAWAQGHSMHGGSHGRGGPRIPAGFDEVRGPEVNLSIGSGHRIVQGRRGPGIAVNGSVPGPLIRLTEGDTVRLNVTNTLDVDSSVHWHGLLVPFQYDGVPGISFPGIRPGETFTYEFPVRQSGTYWYHSHSGLQEQSGHYGPLIIEPKGGETIAVDRDYILLVSDFTTLDPHFIMKRLRTGEGFFNRQQNTWTDDYPMSGEERRMWAQMRMMPTDIADIGGKTYTFLANGRGPKEGMEYLFKAGERIRLRIINGAAMTFFNIRIPGLPMTVIATDGQRVRPVEVDELQIGTAETYDVILEPGSAPAYSIVAESMDRSGMALATLASAPGLRAEVPALRDPPLLTMGDMGMNHGNGMDHGSMDHGSMDHGSGSMSMQGMKMRDTTLLPPDVKVGPGIDMVSMAPVDKMGDPGLGLRDVPHRVLNYRMLAAAEPNPEAREPTRLLELHLTGNMERYMWSFDGRMYSAVSDVPIRFAWNERVRVKLVNNTMMAHPIHLHGLFFEMVNGQSAALQPRKNTMIVQPGASAQFDLTANEPGDWAFHCHLLYHMHGGMMQTVTVAGPERAA
ncbi:MAG: copper-binding protein [Sphingomonadales bacterium RIFCSPHIGHO2_01_FULL_65_20]|uniref:copper resistance system multicopper oxidase n=1 Tax=unclassified Blastomonas TaxID=2626550 RepID=UPI0008364843|nr:copper resistance system multicopper oxidase [Blastomonas sp.]MCH2236285.1 copper resistance system multicopper oxidase [Blastomonas sp.]OHC94724.1 MAG: copper-binding protein [Sphingomonadales bacterium RIFCSPHIGHO2_01_FULL_65_20]